MNGLNRFQWNEPATGALSLKIANGLKLEPRECRSQRKAIKSLTGSGNAPAAKRQSQLQVLKGLKPQGRHRQSMHTRCNAGRGRAAGTGTRGHPFERHARRRLTHTQGPPTLMQGAITSPRTGSYTTHDGRGPTTNREGGKRCPKTESTAQSSTQCAGCTVRRTRNGLQP